MVPKGGKMTKKRVSSGKAETKKLKLKKETLKDLDSSDAKRVRGGMLFLSGKGCGLGVTGGCGAVNKKQVTVSDAKDCF
jgi:hypothetical protein